MSDIASTARGVEEHPARTATAATPTDSTDPGLGPTSAAPARVRGLVGQYGLLILLAGMVAFFAIHPTSGSAFRSTANVQALLANQAVGLVVAVALLLPLAAGFFDFSVGAVTASTSLVAATAMSRFELPLAVAVALAMVAGLLLGMVIGGLVAYLETNPFIATLGVATLLGGIIFAYTGGLQVTSGIPTTLTDVGSLTWFGVPRVAVVAVVVAGAIWFLMSQTAFGRKVFAVGSNARAAQLVGVDVRRVQFGAFTVAGLVGGAAGVLLLARQGAATSDSGMALLFPALTAVLLSTIVIKVGVPSVPGTMIGILFIAVSTSGLTLIGAPAWVGQVFNGAALLIAVGFARLGRRT